MRTFCDTNVLVYGFDRADPVKWARAWEVLEEPGRQLIISSQVLQEFYVTTTRKLAVPLPPADAQAAVEQFCRWTVVPSDSALVRRGVRTAIDHQLSLWDAMIVEAAVTAGCSTLLTEDLNSGPLRGLDIVNPFA